MDYPIQEVSCGVPYVIVPVRTVENIQNLTFNTQIWEELQYKLKKYKFLCIHSSGLIT